VYKRSVIHRTEFLEIRFFQKIGFLNPRFLVIHLKNVVQNDVLYEIIGVRVTLIYLYPILFLVPKLRLGNNWGQSNINLSLSNLVSRSQTPFGNAFPDAERRLLTGNAERCWKAFPTGSWEREKGQPQGIAPTEPFIVGAILYGCPSIIAFSQVGWVSRRNDL